MPGTGQPIAADAAVILVFIRGLPKAGKTHDHISRCDLIIRDQLVLRPARRHGAIDSDGPYHVAYVRRLSTQVLNAYTKCLQLIKELLGPIDNGLQHFPGYILLITVDSRREKEIVMDTHTEQV